MQIFYNLSCFGVQNFLRMSNLATFPDVKGDSNIGRDI